MRCHPSQTLRLHFRKMVPLLAVGVIGLIFGWLGVPALEAENEPISPPPRRSTLDAEVESALTYLLDQARDKDASFQAAQIHALIDYVMDDRTDVEKDTPARRFDGSGAIVRSRMQAPITRVRQYLYNPDFPSYLIMPKMLRLSGWHPDSDLASADAALWPGDPDTETAVVLRGREFEVTTPDTFSGGYYRYDLDRLILWWSYQGQPVLISVSRSVAPSEVGKRAFIIDDENWTYLYSEETGLSLNLLQWADTYIYDTASVMVFHAVANQRGATAVTLFKWLNAGWLGMNVVRETHIRQGSRRSVDHLKKIIESDTLPSLETLAGSYARAQALSDQDLDRLIRNYAERIEQAAENHAALSEEKYDDVLRNGGYARLLNRQERIGVVMVEYLKNSMGKKSLIHSELVNSLLAESAATPTIVRRDPAVPEFWR